MKNKDIKNNQVKEEVKRIPLKLATEKDGWTIHRKFLGKKSFEECLINTIISHS